MSLAANRRHFDQLYEIYTYDTEEDYDSSKFSFLDGCYKSMRDAMSVVKSEKVLEDYAVVKVQSLDLEEVEVLRKGNDDH